MENVRGNLRMVDADGENLLDDLSEAPSASIIVLHNNIMAALCKAYPQWERYWHVTVDTRGGIVQIRNLALSGDFGIGLHIVNIDPEMRRVRKSAGELLERFGVLRNKAISIKQALADVERNNMGGAKHEE